MVSVRGSIRRLFLSPTSCSSLVVLTIMACFALYVYYVNYTSIYLGSKAAYEISRDKSSETAFQAFYWITECLAAIILSGLYFGGLAAFEKVGVELSSAEAWGSILLFIFCFTIPFWIRFPIYNSMYNKVYDNSCNGWDFRGLIVSVDYSPYLSNLPPNIVNITLTMNTTVFLLSVYRNPLSPLTYDLVFQNDSTTFYPSITYDTQNSIITYPDGNLSFTANPNLGFPSLSLYQVDPSIPWTRSDYYACWPPAVNLVYASHKVLETVTLESGDCSTLLVCGSGYDLTRFQIALGLTAIAQFQYSLCCTSLK